jgi:hypothetical protein
MQISNYLKRKDILMFGTIGAALLLIFSINSQIALAHQRELFNIGGKDYLLVVGSENEPVFVDDKTGVDFFAYTPDPKDPMNSKANDTKPIDGLEKTLKVEVTAGDKKRVFDLEPAFRDPGHYNAPFYPTVQTTYEYRIFGNIENTNVSLPFTCNPGIIEENKSDNSTVKISNGVERKGIQGGFSCPDSRDKIAFPEPYMSNVEIQNKLNQSSTSTNSTSNNNTTATIK